MGSLFGVTWYGLVARDRAAGYQTPIPHRCMAAVAQEELAVAGVEVEAGSAVSYRSVGHSDCADP